MVYFLGFNKGMVNHVSGYGRVDKQGKPFFHWPFASMLFPFFVSFLLLVLRLIFFCHYPFWWNQVYNIYSFYFLVCTHLLCNSNFVFSHEPWIPLVFYNLGWIWSVSLQSHLKGKKKKHIASEIVHLKLFLLWILKEPNRSMFEKSEGLHRN